MTTFKGNPVTLIGNPLQPGMMMPDFEVIDVDLNPVRPMEKKGKKIILSVPSPDTGVCSIELAKFMQALRGHDDIEAMSVSMDLPFALARWNKAEDNETIHTYSDYKDHDFANKTGTTMEENGLLARAVFVTDENGELVHVEYVDEVGHEPDYKAALTAAGL